MSDEEEDTPFWRGIAEVPDCAFPLGLNHAPLVVWPDRGLLIDVACCACRRRGRFTGLDLCRNHSPWLTRDACEWAKALRCDGCGSSRLNFSTGADQAAHGFRENGHHDSSDAMRIRRLLAWLPQGGLRLDDVAYLLRDIDAVRLRDAGLPEEVWSLFQTSYGRCTFYRPTPGRVSACPPLKPAKTAGPRRLHNR